MGIEIRQTAPDDPVALRLAEALRDEVEARKAHNGAARPDTPLAAAVRADSDTLVAYADSKPVALGALRSFGPGVAEIKRMDVLPAHRGSGLGGRILDELERCARERGFEAVRLDTNTRLSEAIALYERAGYRRSRTTTRTRGRTAGTRNLSPEFP
jgi:GNAT superfamily N-acetyltransferase